jgi:magnesium-transporting ATPase (P-type)
MRIPADCILLEGQDITCDETIYNEGRAMVNAKQVSKGAEHHRENPDPFLLTNSLVMTGSGRAVVCAVGKHTRFASEFPTEQLTDDEQLTPLQERLEKLAGYIGKFGYIAGFLIFLTMTIFLVFQIMFTDEQLLSWSTALTVLRYFSVGVSIVIVAVPEGLPLAVSISMAFSVDVMKKDNLLVKKVEAPETLGYIREICTGKTATLTKNDMTVNKFYTAGSIYDHRENSLLESGINEKVVEIVKDCIILNCDARIEMSEDAKYSPEGNGTEVGMLRFLQDNNLEVQDLLAKRHREGEHECSIPFGPVRKRQVEVIRPYKGCEYVRVVVKGAPEYVIQYCNSILGSDGEITDLDENER